MWDRSGRPCVSTPSARMISWRVIGPLSRSRQQTWSWRGPSRMAELRHDLRLTIALVKQRRPLVLDADGAMRQTERLAIVLDLPGCPGEARRRDGLAVEDRGIDRGSVPGVAQLQEADSVRGEHAQCLGNQRRTPSS